MSWDGKKYKNDLFDLKYRITQAGEMEAIFIKVYFCGVYNG